VLSKEALKKSKSFFAGWRIRKSYIMVKPLKEPKVKQILSWVSYVSYHLNLKRIKAALGINFKKMLGQSF